jgi:GT2 family glycosyltransferase
MTMISVIVLNFNGKRHLEKCILALAAQTYENSEVIVVDNASSDGSVEYLEAQFPWVTIIKNKNNLGFAGGINSGIKKAHGDYILTLNDDTYADKHFLEHIIHPMLSHADVGMCACKMLFPDGRINSAGICLSRSGAAWDRGMHEPDEGRYNAQEEVFGPCAGAALYRKEMLDEIGLFDEDFFLYIEDVDLAFRGRLAGWKCVYVPQAKVYHYHGGTAGFGSDLSVYYGNRNVIWYAVKDFPRGLLITSLPFIVGRNLAVIPYYALHGKGRVILRSKMDALMGVPRMVGKRRYIAHKVPEKEIKSFIKTWCDIKSAHNTDNPPGVPNAESGHLIR